MSFRPSLLCSISSQTHTLSLPLSLRLLSQWCCCCCCCAPHTFLCQAAELAQAAVALSADSTQGLTALTLTATSFFSLIACRRSNTQSLLLLLRLPFLLMPWMYPADSGWGIVGLVTADFAVNVTFLRGEETAAWEFLLMGLEKGV